jgi:hypothetical protein
VKRSLIPGILSLSLMTAGCKSASATPPAFQPAAVPILDAAPAEPVRLSEDADLIAALPNILLDVEMDYIAHTMQVRQIVEMSNTSQDAWDEIVFNVPVGAVPGIFVLQDTTVGIGPTITPVIPDFTDGDTILRLPLPETVLPGQALQVVMHYEVIIPPVYPEEVPPTGLTGWNDNLIQAGEWYPMLVPYQDSQGWHTWDYVPTGDPFVYPLVNYRLRILADEGITVVSGGAMGKDEDGYWHFEMPAARGIALMASHRYRMAQGEANELPIFSYYLPQHEDGGKAALEVAQQSITLYEELYGPYPYASLTIAENGYLGGMEYSGLITISPRSYGAEDREEFPLFLPTLVAHETAHQWWYGAVGNDQVYEPWLDEGLAYYSERLYLDRYMPGEMQDWWDSRVVLLIAPESPIDSSLYENMQSDTPSTFIYPQYGYFVHHLRQEMGDDAFFAFLKDYYHSYSGQMATAANFRELAQQHSPTDLTSLFQIYFSDTP